MANLADLIEDTRLTIKKMSLNKDDILVIQIPDGKYTKEQILSFSDYTTSLLGRLNVNVSILILPNDWDIKIINKEDENHGD